MPLTFDQQIVLWQPFFTTVATVAATLVGLLFVQIQTTFRSGQAKAGGGLVMEYLLPAFSILGLVASGIGIYREAVRAIYYCTVPVIAILLVQASRNAWRLLIMESH